MMGERFGRLVVVSEAHRYGRGIIWRCQCDCGREAKVSGRDLRAGNKRSCGCAHHGYGRVGGKRSPTYTCWAGMLSRCRNPNDAEYHNYGARGILVCERWKDFRNFLADMGEKPRGRSIERVNNAKGYQPGNCVWATSGQQSRNTRRNIRVQVGNESLVLIDAAEKLGIAHGTLYQRIHRGWSGDRLLEAKHKPNDPKGPKK